MSTRIRTTPPATLEVALLEGPTDRQVLQRAARGLTDIVLAGTTSVASLTLSLLDANGAVAGVKVQTGAGRWQARLPAPTGGPYHLEASDGDASVVLVRDFLVGDLWVLAGQSNMQGFAHTDGLDPSHPQVHVLDMARQWRLADDHLHRLSESPDPVHCGETEDEKNWFRMFDGVPTFGAGLGLTFGRELVQRTGIPVGLIATAHAGSALRQWDPGLRSEAGRSMYGSMMLSIEAAGGRVAGVAWYQGETEAMEGRPTFAEELDALVVGMRRDLADPGLPFYHVQVGRVTGVYPNEAGEQWSTVRELQRTHPAATGFVSAIDLELCDPIHIDAVNLRRLGRRLARLVAGEASSLDVAAVIVEGDGLSVLVEYSGVTGTLRAAQRIRGFSLSDAGGAQDPLVYRADVLEARPNVVRLRLARVVADGDQLWFGRGLDPCCDLVDSEDMAAPAFGPWPLVPSPPGP